MRNCYVYGCDKKNKNERKRPMFFVPKEQQLFAKWKVALPGLRPLKQGDRVCCLHFRNEDIEKSFQHVIGGRIYQIERDRMRLKANAVPALNLPREEELMSSSQKRTSKALAQSMKKNCIKPEDSEQHQLENQPQNLTDLSAFEILIETENEQQHNDQIGKEEEELVEEINPSECIKEQFTNLYDDVFEVILPNTLWGIHRCAERSIIFFVYMDALKMYPTKMLTVDCNGLVKIFLCSQLIRTLSILNDVHTTATLSELLAQLDAIELCDGNTMEEYYLEIQSAENHNNES